ncbi:MAG: sigma-70 family RNA polymerase sigma factor [Planctomycetes bacterium]|nr:sigma-70 family RNA polymerase sigma factor [Planctomycetota bacterium]
MEEMDLIRQSQQNNRQAFNQLVLKHQDVLYNTLYRMIGNEDDALDICQEAFIRAFVNIKSFRGNSSFLTWLCQIAINQYYTHHQKAKKEKERKVDYQIVQKKQVVQAYSSGLTDMNNPSINPTQPVQAKEQEETVQNALNSLEPEMRKIVVLKDMEDLSYTEISAMVKKPVHIVRTRLCQARQQLRTALKKYL